jgi:predicted phage terminase large subunit-like protein
VRHLYAEGFQGVIFRRETPQIRNPGGLWDESKKIYALIGAKPKESLLEWNFRKWRIKFSHMEKEMDVQNWQGAQLAYLGWDELTHFTRTQFFYMLSRLRSMSGVKPYVRATCNPDPDSWVADFIAWWIDQETGYAIPERAGVLRWFIRVNDELIWADSKEELVQRYPEDGQFALSVTFIPANVDDNKKMLEQNPGYIANLNALSLVDRMRLRFGNWKIRATAGTLFQRGWFPVVDAAPADAVRIRYWDRAATEEEAGKDPDWTAGVLLSRDRQGIYYIEDVDRFRGSPGAVEKRILNIASQDGPEVSVGIEQDPGQAGKAEAGYYVRSLAGYNVKCYPVSADKVTRAKPASAQAEAGNIKIVRGPWNKPFLDEAENFPGKGKKDQVDAFSGAFNAIALARPTPRIITL